MKQHHKSHHIFAFLGALLLIFIVFFGVQYFQQQYTFESVALDNSQSYEEGDDTTNPFLPHPDELGQDEDQYSWVTFGSTKMSFLYPDQFALRVMNGGMVGIIPPLSNAGAEECNHSDEQAQAECLNPPESPNIMIQIGTNTWPAGLLADNAKPISITGIKVIKNSFQTEFGGVTAYQWEQEGVIVQISYDHTDVSGGVQFKVLHNEYGNQYQLNANEQDKLALAIMKTVVVK